VPRCDHCEKEWLATTRGPMEECPGCGAAVAVAAEERPVPWHFKLLVVATVVYLGWRAVQGVVWLIQRF
jgi:hypothetical protein